MPRYCLKVSRELHAKLKIVAERNDLKVTQLISGAILACGDVADPDSPLIVGSTDTLIGVKTRRLDSTFPKA